MKAEDILDALSSSHIVQKIEVIVLVAEPSRQALRARALLKNGFVLHINESFGKGFRSYSYHLQWKEQMVRRWDNAPHWPHLKTFPHHLHLNDGKDAVGCPEIFIQDALLEIESIIESESK